MNRVEGRSKILCVDDDPDLLLINSHILQSVGYEVLAASTGNDCLRIAKEEHPDLILLDVVLPDINGIDVCKQIKADQELVGTYIILISGMETSSESQVGGLEAGADEYIVRPISGRELLARVQAMLRIKKSEVRHKKAKAEAEEAKLLAEAAYRAKSDFLANMSHELTTPLNSIIGFSQILQDGLYGELNEKQKEYVSDILNSGIHLLGLIHDMLDLVKIDTDRAELRISKFLLKDVLKTSMEMFKEEALKHNLKLSFEIEPDADREIETDPGMLRQILFNLLSNALKFTPHGGSITMEAKKLREYEVESFLASQPLNFSTSEDFVQISVTDTGIGIKPEDIDNIFQVFTQLESPYAKKYEGTGLGLALTKKLVELHGGRIWVESEYGKGSKFSFVIPVKQKK